MFPRLALVASLVLPATLVQQPPPQSPRGRVETQSQRATERIRALQQEAEALAGREKTLLGELRRLEIERDLRGSEVERLESEIASLQGQVAAMTAQMQDLDQAVREKRPALAARLVDTYKLGRPGYARLWFAVEDLRALGRTYRLLSALARIDRDRIADYQSSVERLAVTRGDIDRRLAQLAALGDEARRQQAASNAAVAARTALIAEVDLRRDLNAQMVGELRQANAKLQQMLASLAGAGDARPDAAEPVILPLRPFKGQLDWPAPGQLITTFGPRVHPRFGTTTISTGIEISAADGSPARAVHEGVVAFADVFSGFGLLVILDHGNQSFSLYGHLATTGVQRGAHVTSGQAVGAIGRGPSGRASLYFELRIDGQPVDPVQWLRNKSGT